ncbi:type VI secretion system protein TssA [Cupriavidus oxalaticus]|jgi:type VI secretion system protein ImpA|uniref:Type VI secretion system protein TssA n=2 Tax=Cupriavidus oxalaticus TaxID=96344 RepID=A0ABX7HN52_9BURK|nr:type VI secretion system protein TssA [Cupriavidus oxalaticus]QRQ84469.1 type VI secretion system protein TssA [Cupriavidus oxalaticus]QRQ91443.1 type VI secretion system protein TssA [Cupriavidus oxalaticus]WQD86008.1 type VI secretion system protein TssA [Cupriavidus oxalaticus]
MKTKSRTARSDAPRPLRLAELAQPIDAAHPCGPDLAYDPEFVVLMAKASPGADAQYGDFVAQAEPPNWTELERDCRRLLMRSKDIRLLILLLRCRTRLGHAEGLRDGMALLQGLLADYPEDIHPQLMVEGEHDPALRANAFAALIDPDGLLSDVREIVLAGNGTTRLQVRDIERALALPHPADALAPESVRQQLDALRRQGMRQVAAMDEACKLAGILQRWADETLAGHAPDLSQLGKLLGLAGNRELAGTTGPVAPPDHPVNAEPESMSDASHAMAQSAPTPVPASVDGLAGRDAALRQVRALRQWFEQHEPSSPVALLLWQAERLVGKRFEAVFRAIPEDLVERWVRESA